MFISNFKPAHYGSNDLAQNRSRPLPLRVHTRLLPKTPDIEVGCQLDEWELKAVRHTLEFLVHDRVIDPDSLPGLLDRAVTAVSARVLGYGFSDLADKPRSGHTRLTPPDEARSWVDKWGSARSALEAALVGRSGKGRKPGFLKDLVEMADEEERAEVKELPVEEYRFSGIPRTPKVPIDQSVHDGYLVCLIDGSRRTFLTRYLRAHFGMTPQEYRIHFGLPSDYPMTAGNYRTLRSHLARSQGLGLPGGKSSK